MIDNLVVVNKRDVKKTLQSFKRKGYRLITIIGAIKDEKMELTYALESENRELAALRTYYELDDTIISVQDVYMNAMLYEMEVVDLFDVKIENCSPGLLLEPNKRGPFRRDV